MGIPFRVRGGRWLLPGPVVALLLIGAAVTFVAPETGETVGFLGLVTAPVIAGTLIYKRSRALAHRERAAWLWIAVALYLICTGVGVIGLLTELGVELPAFGVMDIFFLGAYLAIIVALYKLVRLDHGGQEWVLTLIDALVGGIALATLVWTYVFGDLMAALAGGRWWEAAIAATYPLLDIVLVVGIFVLILKRSSYHLDPRLAFFAFGAGAQVLADLIFLNNGVGQLFENAEPAWALNLIAMAFLLLTATIVDRAPRRREFAETPTPVWALMWPYLFAVWLAAVHFQTYRNLGPGSDEVLILDGVIAIGVVIFLRQVYVIYRDRGRVDQKRSELVASVSHELRTPLTAMVGFLTLLDEQPDEFPVDAQREMIAEAATQARHMSRLVADLLMLARGDTSYMTVEPAEVRAMTVLTSVLRGTDPGDSRIEEDFDADVVVRVDPDRIKQALANLINNAVRYGGKHVLVVARVRELDLIFEVHDDGEGVPTRYEAAIWHHFERGAHRLDSTTPGLGIGLSIVRAVIDSHGGETEYRVSERLGGACFSLTIPGCVVEEVPAPSGKVTVRS